ncbi:MAG: hypothetical protein HQL82_02535 [Magnetococcales bacterium]|nr:hypothetical protein [Magnetococcales bacterium]
MVRDCLELCLEAGVPATFFATHDSPVLDEIRAQSRFELGIHPNFQTGSTHGADFAQVMATCMALVPEARCMRTHGLFQSVPLFKWLGDHYPQIAFDVSLFIPGQTGLRPLMHYYGMGNQKIMRLPFTWEDDICFYDPHWDWGRVPAPVPGMAIYNYHPVHVALNTPSADHYYRNYKPVAARHPSGTIGREDCRALTFSGSGTRSHLEGLLQRIPARSFFTIPDLPGQFDRDLKTDDCAGS